MQARACIAPGSVLRPFQRVPPRPSSGENR
jgi:hypothetical protein